MPSTSPGRRRTGVIACGCLLLSLITTCVYLTWQHSTPKVVDAAQVSISLSGERMYRGKPLTGTAESYHPNGQLASSDAFVNGRRHGYARKWFENGQIGYQAFYQSELKQGTVRSWWSNGNPRYAVTYVNGLQEGEGWHWYRTGEKFKRFNYQAGQPVGLQQAWRQNGELFSNFEYRNGRVYGLKKSNTCVGLENEEVSLEYYNNQAG